MKKIFTLSLMMSFLMLNAQLFDLSQNTLEISTDQLDADVIVKSYLINNGTFDIIVDWEVTNTDDLPIEWRDYNSFCFTPLAGAANGACIDLTYLYKVPGKDTLRVGDSIELKLAVDPRNFPDTAYMKVLLDAVESGNTANEFLDTVDMVVEFKGEKPTAINDLENNINLRLYPNPAKNTIYFEQDIKGDVERIEIFNVIGRKVYSELASKSKITQVNVSNLDKGIYIAKVFSKNNNLVYTQSFIKQ